MSGYFVLRVKKSSSVEGRIPEEDVIGRVGPYLRVWRCSQQVRLQDRAAIWEGQQAAPPSKQESSQAPPPFSQPLEKAVKWWCREDSSHACTDHGSHPRCKKQHCALHPKVRTLQNGDCARKGSTDTTEVTCQSAVVAPLKLAVSQHLGASDGMNSQGKESP